MEDAGANKKVEFGDHKRWRVGELARGASSSLGFSFLAPVTAAMTVAVAVGVGLGGFASALEKADTHFSSPDHFVSSVLAVGEAFRAPWFDASKSAATISLQNQVANNFYHGPRSVVPEDMVPKTRMDYKYVGSNEYLNAYARNTSPKSQEEEHEAVTATKTDDAKEPKASFDFVVKTRADGTWFAEDAYKKAGFDGISREAAAFEVGGHELAHTVYPKTVGRFGWASVEKTLRKAGLSPSDAEVAGVGALMHESSWQDSVVNESFADAMAMISLAKIMPKEQFEKALEIQEERRAKSYGKTMHELDKKAPLTTPSKRGQIWLEPKDVDVHMTYETVQVIKAAGYEKLRALSREEAPKFALDSAHEGFLGMVVKHKPVFSLLGGAEHGLYVPMLLEAAAKLSEASQKSLAKQGAGVVEALGAGATTMPVKKKLNEWRAGRVEPSGPQSPAPKTSKL
jgi:hypothetical protein